MKIEVNLSKRNVFFAIFGIFIFTGLIFVIAYNPSFSGGNATVFGHSADEVNVKMIGEIDTTQKMLDNFYGKTECKINFTELKNKGCPFGSYLYKMSYVNLPTAYSYCKRFYTNTTTPTVSWCYIADHPIVIPPNPSDCTVNKPGCGYCCDSNIGEFCCTDALYKCHIGGMCGPGSKCWYNTGNECQ